jgi:hypothetical protein
MNFAQSPPAAASAVYQATDPGVFSGALVGGEFEFLPMPGTCFDGTLRLLRVDGFIIQQPGSARMPAAAPCRPACECFCCQSAKLRRRPP